MPLRAWIKLAWRDLRGSLRHSLALLLVTTLCVAAHVAIRSTAGNFVGAISNLERSGIGGDFSVELNHNPEPAQIAVLEQLKALGANWTLVSSTVFLTRSPQASNPLPTVIKSVDPKGYPLYGELRLNPPLPLERALAGSTAVVSSELLRELGLRVGDSFLLNGLSCTIAAVLEDEPDRFAGDFASSLRAIVSNQTMEATGILRTTPSVLFRLAVAIPASADPVSIRTRLENTFPDADVFDASDSVSPETDAANTVSWFLEATGWLAIALGAAGIVVAARLLVESRLDTMAMLKCVGARPAGVRGWLALEFLLLGAVGSCGGCLLGMLAGRFLLWMAGVCAAPALSPLGSLLEGLATGVGLSAILGFAWALPASRMRPAGILRRNAGDPPLRVNPVLSLAFAAVAAVAFTIDRGIRPSLPLAVITALAALYGISVAGFRLLRRTIAKLLLPRFRLLARFAIRRLFLNGAGSPAILALVAFIAAFVLVLSFGETIVIRQILRSLPLAESNLYVMGFAHSDLAGIRSILDRHAGIARPYDIRSLTWFRVAPRNAKTAPLSMVACSEDLPPDAGVVIDTSTALRLGVRAGSPVELERGGKTTNTVVGLVRDVPPADRMWSSITVPCGAVARSELFHHAGLKVNTAELDRLRLDLRARYPALTVTTPEDAFGEVAKIVRMGAAFVKLLSFFTISGATVILTALIAAFARRRAREIALLRALGASRSLLARMLTCEFAVLGALGGFIGGVVGILSINLILSIVLERRIADLHGVALVLAAASGCGLYVTTGWLICAPLLEQRPFVILRRE